ncbi:MAG: ArsC/Spx/MgsR family protein [SAR202 cluster bacterium]|nr:ArsC/Spx/MgsR family protein [SAR202 cluster bacterium]MDP6716134.1 ArsC/Spx/MgsR family protein [SAR202 cluster bacterium]
MKAELSQKGVELDERDFFQDGFTEDELRALIGERPVSGYFSYNSPSFRKMGLDRDQISDDQLLKMMVDEPRLVRRPLIHSGDELVIGTDKKAMARVFG